MTAQTGRRKGWKPELSNAAEELKAATQRNRTEIKIRITISFHNFLLLSRRLVVVWRSFRGGDFNAFDSDEPRSNAESRRIDKQVKEDDGHPKRLEYNLSESYARKIKCRKATATREKVERCAVRLPFIYCIRCINFPG